MPKIMEARASPAWRARSMIWPSSTHESSAPCTTAGPCPSRSPCSTGTSSVACSPCAGSIAEARHVLVTGAAGAIGGALAELLAKECPRARMTLVDKRAIPNGRVWDLSKPDALEAEYAELGERVDVLVNCAGFMELMSFAG